MKLDPTDKSLARKRAREAAEEVMALDGALSFEDYISRFPTLDPSGYPIEEDPYLDAQAGYLLGRTEEGEEL